MKTETEDRFLVLKQDAYGQWLAFPDGAEPLTLDEALRCADRHIKSHAIAGLDPDKMRLVRCSEAFIPIGAANIAQLTGPDRDDIIERGFQRA